MRMLRVSSLPQRLQCTKRYDWRNGCWFISLWQQVTHNDAERMWCNTPERRISINRLSASGKHRSFIAYASPHAQAPATSLQHASSSNACDTDSLNTADFHSIMYSNATSTVTFPTHVPHSQLIDFTNLFVSTIASPKTKTYSYIRPSFPVTIAWFLSRLIWSASLETQPQRRSLSTSACTIGLT